MKGIAVPKSPRSFAFSVGGAALATLALFGALAGAAAITQKGDLRVALSGKISPKTLPRSGVAPIAVSVGGQVSTADESLPPQLRVLKIEINRNGRLDYRGLPTCSPDQIQPATNERALSACRAALVGQGTFNAYIVLKGQEPYPASGRLLLFNSREGAHQVLLGHIYIAQPFASSFLIPFQIGGHPHGRFDTTLTADIAQSLGARRYLTGIEMTLQRSYSFQGKRHSFISAGCPAPRGVGVVNFPLARAGFAFAGNTKITSTLTRTCRARG
jgi:hypothetical protein